MSGLGEHMKGGFKEAAGRLTGDEQLEAEGKVDQMVGDAKDGVEDMKDSAAHKLNEFLDDNEEPADTRDNEE